MKPLTPYRPEIRFADIDAMGHVNNAVYLTYMEQARIHLFGQFSEKGWDWRDAGLIVARNEIEYLRPILLGDRIAITVGCSHVGGKSFHLTYHFVREGTAGREEVSRGKSVMVCFNHSTGATEEIPDAWRSALDALRQLTS